MIEGLSPVSQALLGTLFTWAVTAAGSALVFVFNKSQVNIIRDFLIACMLKSPVNNVAAGNGCLGRPAPFHAFVYIFEEIKFGLLNYNLHEV